MQGGIAPIQSRGGRGSGFGGLQPSPWVSRKGTADADQLKGYREGLESDRKFLEKFQSKERMCISLDVKIRNNFSLCYHG